jgi:hypothetical protein
MKFEFVEFYPYRGPKKTYEQKKTIGTVHVYVYLTECDFQFDLRGIKFLKTAKKSFFKVPETLARDEETQKMVRYPFFSFSKMSDWEKLHSFLKQSVEPIIEERLKSLVEGE